MSVFVKCVEALPILRRQSKHALSCSSGGTVFIERSTGTDAGGALIFGRYNSGERGVLVV